MVRAAPIVRRDRFRIGLLGFCLLTVMASTEVSAQSRIQLPDLGDASSSVFSSADEKRLGDAFLREIRASTDRLDDPEVEAYVNYLGFRLVGASGNPGRAFTFFMISDPNINAFAGPNGVIGVNTGLLLAVDNEGELAAVLAHEVAHVTQQHIARTIEQNERYSIPALAGLLAALILSTQNAQAGSAATAAVLGKQLQSQIDLIRANEYEADRVGIGILARAGYDPRAMPAFFARLQESSRYYPSPPEFLSTHPVTGNRIAESRARASKIRYKQFLDSEAFYRVRAKLEVLVQGPKKALPLFEQRLADGIGGSAPANRYGKALALMRLERFPAARPVLARLVRDEPDSIPYQDAHARCLRELGKVDQAIAIYKQFLRLYLDDRQMTIGLAETLLASGDAREAARVLEAYLRSNSDDAYSFNLLARSYERQRKTAASLLALGEYHYLNGRLRQALFQLERAQRSPSQDYYLDARIGARIKQLRDEQTERSDN